MIRLIPVFAAAAFATGAAAADQAEPWIGFFNAKYHACSTKTFDEAALAKLPNQTVTEVIFAYTPTMTPHTRTLPENRWDYEGGVPGFTAMLAFRVKGDDRLAGAEFHCIAGADENELACETPAPGDPGKITVNLVSAKGDLWAINILEPFIAGFEPAHETRTASTAIDPKDQNRLTVTPAVSCDEIWETFFPGATTPKP